MTIKFTITGNHEDQTGNPIPKLKMTGGQHWTPQAQRYTAWKAYVQKVYLKQIKIMGMPVALDDGMKKKILASGKPICIIAKGKAHMTIKIFWKNRAHGDPENVFGSIADALFVDDRNLDGSFESQVAKDKKGRVEVEIKVE